MKILRGKWAGIFIVFAAMIFFAGSCKKDSDLVEFNLAPINTESLQLDGVVDTTTNGQQYYSDTLLISNNFFRTACEENGVNISDVESVFLESSSVEIVSPQNITGSYFTSITQIFLTPNGLLDTISKANVGISAIPGELTPKPKNLKMYFDNVATTMPVFFGVGDSSLSGADVKYNLTFKVRGYSH